MKREKVGIVDTNHHNQTEDSGIRWLSIKRSLDLKSHGTKSERSRGTRVISEPTKIAKAGGSKRVTQSLARCDSVVSIHDCLIESKYSLSRKESSSLTRGILLRTNIRVHG